MADVPPPEIADADDAPSPRVEKPEKADGSDPCGTPPADMNLCGELLG
jgi:hypothetical protein